MKTTLTPDLTRQVIARLDQANAAFAHTYPGESDARQPVHTVYGGAHLFKADSAQKLGSLALRAMEAYAPDFAVFAKALGLPGHGALPDARGEIAALAARIEQDEARTRSEAPDWWRAFAVHRRVLDKLRREPVEDFRIDFEDGYGNRSDDEEDSHAARAAEEVARGMEARTLPPFSGIRVKPFTQDLKHRSIRTLDVFLSTLIERTGGKLPANFIVTLPKVGAPAEVAALVDLFEILETRTALAPGSLKLEIMVEITQAIMGPDGRSTLPLLAEAARGRCVAAHFGTYDFTASYAITAPYQTMDHPACDFAMQMMKVAFAGTGIFLSDGATTVMPVAPRRAPKDGPPLTPAEERENREAVHHAWRIAYDNVRHSLRNAYYQGWDLHPAQLPVRYAAVFGFFLEGLEAASVRLRNFVEQAAQATLVGDVFDDAATGQGLLNYFLRGLNCGAISEQEALATGLTIEELRSRSFVKILDGRCRKARG